MSLEDKFCPMTLKLDRGSGFKLDVDRLYAMVLPLQKIHNLSITDFKSKWVESKMFVIGAVDVS